MRIYATFHPTSVLEGGFNLEEYIRDDLRRFKRKQLRAPNKKLPRVGSKTLGFDTEFGPDGRLLTVGLSDIHCAAAIETTNSAGMRKIRPVIKRAQIVVGHSVDGDLDYLVRLGLAKEDWLRGVNVRDSLLLARMADENKGRGGYGLEALMLSEFATTPWKDETAALLKKTGSAVDWTEKQRTERCRLDAWATLLLASKLYQRVLQQTDEVHNRRLR